MAGQHLLIWFSLAEHLVEDLRSCGLFETVQHFQPKFVEGSTHPDQLWGFEPPEIPDECWQKVTVLLTNAWLPRSPEQAPNLRLIQTMSAGVEHYLTREDFFTNKVRCQVQLASAAGVHSSAIGEQVLMHTLAHFYEMRALNEIQASRSWNRSLYVPPGQIGVSPELRGQTIGVIGYGCIGREVARLATAFGMKVLAASSTGRRAAARGYTIAGTGDDDGSLPEAWYPSGDAEAMKDFWAKSDVVVLCCPVTETTKHLINASTLKQMKQSSFLVNVSRGAVIDQDALIEALENKQIAGAFVDVTDPEPLPKDHPLWTTKNCTVTPHVTGATNMYETRCAELLKINMARLIAGECPKNAYDLKAAITCCIDG
ncbi:hypothetical protein BCR37DRAFT_280847 [Protomyces lactucae-debilis]|uniref:D-isomer specific 2-hydroxyacid dehydrogenase NAD-binding domain-containing protein n=1 Tax=Protomyces lactucae-debilis TaxID=2754530 RepID=A0A1Y2FIN3_PROLT|nr:uncharacterized protein BCR37DRAFT_280847 [Protomyces lactucae-debilis]ORY83810.1 hypothetical protein BCR37DRAFT_280847 [Protomyces lactucae-debilis]